MGMTRTELKNRIGSILLRDVVGCDLKWQWWPMSESASHMDDWKWLCCYKLDDSPEGDCDVSLCSMVFYALALGLREEWYITRQPGRSLNYQLELRQPPESEEGQAEEYVLRGDTMNSYATTMHIYLDLRDKDKKVNPEDECWEELVLRESTAEKVEKLLSPAAWEFIRRVHTIGNMLPVPHQAYAPKTGNRRRATFNTLRKDKTEDYFDLTLLCLYDHFTGDSDDVHTMEWLLEEKGDRAMSQRWLDSFGKGREGWTRFVEQNLLQDFVDRREAGDWGRPKELWEGHFEGSVPPEKTEQCEAFFTNASAWILARSTRMSGKVKEQYPTEFSSVEELLELAETLLPEAKSEGEV